MILALAFSVPLVMQPKTPIAIAFAFPMNTYKQNTYQETPLLTNKVVYLAVPFQNPTPETEVFWVEHLGLHRPELTCSLTHLGRTVYITGPEGKTVTAHPFVMQKPLTIWRRDVLSQWGAKLKVGL